MKTFFTLGVLMVQMGLWASGTPDTVTYQEDGVAIKGYDVVNYFKEGSPAKGLARYSSKHQGATWYFSTLEHKEMFDMNPDRYIPAYGGYCAYAVSQGSTASIDPTQWTIHQGTLYLNYDTQTQLKFMSNIPGHIEKADRNWPTIKADIENK